MIFRACGNPAKNILCIVGLGNGLRQQEAEYYSHVGQVWYLIVSIPDLCNLITLNKTFECKTVNIFLPYSFNICFGCSKELSH